MTFQWFFAPGVRCECFLSVLVHLWISTSNAHTQHGRILNIKVARFNNHYPIAGPYSEHVEHGRCYGNTKSCSLLCLKGLLIFILAFCLNIICPLYILSFNIYTFSTTSLHWGEWWKLCISNSEQTSQIQRLVISCIIRIYMEVARFDILNILKTIWKCVSPAGETDNNSSIHCWHWSCQEAQIEVRDHDLNWTLNNCISHISKTPIWTFRMIILSYIYHTFHKH